MTTFEKSILIKASEHQREGSLINFRAATLCNEVETGGIGRVFIQLVTKEGAQRESGSEQRLAMDLLLERSSKKPIMSYLEIHCRIDAGSSALLGTSISGPTEFTNALSGN